MSHGVSKWQFRTNFTDSHQFEKRQNKLENNNCPVKETEASHDRNHTRALFQFYTLKEKQSKLCPLF